MGGVIGKDRNREVVGEGVGNGYQADNAEGQAESAVAQCDASVMDMKSPLSVRLSGVISHNFNRISFALRKAGARVEALFYNYLDSYS